MKYIKIIMRDKREIVLPFEKVEKLLDSPTQLIKLSDEKGEWSGETINKSEIVATKRDYESEKDEKRIQNTRIMLDEPKTNPEKIDVLLKEYRPNFLK